MPKALVLILISWLFVPGLFAQDHPAVKEIYVEGFITNPEGRYIENVHIVNLKANTGTNSNREGQFRIEAFPGDSLRLTGIGYNPLVYRIPAVRPSPVLPLHIVMESDTILITGAFIYPWPADAEALKQAVLAMDDQTPKVPDLKLNDKRFYSSALPGGTPPSTIPGMANPGLTYTIPGPITALYEAFSKTAKSQRKFEMLVKDDQKREVAARRYNAEVVKQITHFTSDKEIQDFMLFCNLSIDFIIRSSEYDLYLAIHNCLLAYNESNKEEPAR
ncbi:MAG: carboxypeptidase-like regulatory domain-containing protein [Bacteroidales bacterium]